MVPDEWLPVSRDGMGNELGVSSPTVFVNGGGGSVFYPNPNLNPNPNQREELEMGTKPLDCCWGLGCWDPAVDPNPNSNPNPKPNPYNSNPNLSPSPQWYPSP